MKKMSKVLMFALALMALFISACGGVTARESTGGGKGQASLIEFTGVIEAIDGDQWVVDGQTITVDLAALGGVSFAVGDTVKVELEMQEDGSLVVTNVETANDSQNTNDSNTNDDNTNDVNGNEANSNDDNSNDDNTNGINGGVGNANDDNSNDDNSNSSMGDSSGGDDHGGDDGNSNDDDHSDDDNSNDDDSNDDDGDDDSNSNGSS